MRQQRNRLLAVPRCDENNPVCVEAWTERKEGGRAGQFSPSTKAVHIITEDSTLFQDEELSLREAKLLKCDWAPSLLHPTDVGDESDDPSLDPEDGGEAIA